MSSQTGGTLDSMRLSETGVLSEMGGAYEAQKARISPKTSINFSLLKNAHFFMNVFSRRKSSNREGAGLTGAYRGGVSTFAV